LEAFGVRDKIISLQNQRDIPVLSISLTRNKNKIGKKLARFI